jgi:ACT domain-containing protein
MNRTVITVIGKDTIGIIAAVCTYLADNNVNILDINQSTLQDFFHMMMIVDINNCNIPFSDLRDGLTAVGQTKGVVIKCQKEEIFNQMHRI